MSAEINKLVVRIPVEFAAGSTTANDFGVLKVDSDSTHKATAIPALWKGREVAMRAFTNAVVIACSKNSAAEVDRAAAASDAGTSLKVGMTLVANEVAIRRLPDWASHETMYFIHEATTDNTVLEIALAG